MGINMPELASVTAYGTARDVTGYLGLPTFNCNPCRVEMSGTCQPVRPLAAHPSINPICIISWVCIDEYKLMCIYRQTGCPMEGVV